MRRPEHFVRWFENECARGALTSQTVTHGARLVATVATFRMNKNKAARDLVRSLALPDVSRFKESYRVDRELLG